MKRIQLKTVEYSVVSEKVPEAFDGFRMAVLADVHNCRIGASHSLLVNAVAHAHPDCILLAGDMVTEHKKGRRAVEYEIGFDLIHSLCRIAPVYYALGNHEQRWKENELPGRMRFEQWEEMLRSWGVEFLDNATAIIQKDDSRISVGGLSLPGKYFSKMERHKPDEKTLTKLMGTPDRDCFHILMAHTPAFFPVYRKWGADLVLSGHYHGGIVRLPWLGGVISTSYRLFPKYDHGIYQEEGSTMIVSSGLGWHTIPLRINNPPELVIARLQSR